MSQVSTSATRWLLDWLEGHSISASVWVDGICEIDDLLSSENGLPWDTFVELCERVAEFCDSPPEGALAMPSLAGIGREIAEEVFESSESPFNDRDLPVELMFVERLPAAAAQHFRGLDIQADMAANGEVVLFQVNLPDPACECPAFFELIEGALEVVPIVAGHDPADVAMDLQPGGARIAVRVPDAFENVIPIDTGLESHDGVVAGIDGYADFEADREVDEDAKALASSESDLLADDGVAWAVSERESRVDTLVEVEGAAAGSNRTLEQFEGAAPAIDFEAFQDAVASASSLNAAVKELFTALRDELGCHAARLLLDPGAAEPRPTPFKFGRFGRSAKPPAHVFPVHAAGRSLARLEVWREAPFEDAVHDAVERLLPLIGLALLAHRSEAEPVEPAAAPLEPGLALVAPLLDLHRSADTDPLRAVVSALCESSGGHTAAIGLRSANRPMQLRTHVCWRNDEHEQGPGQAFDYDATGTPCAEVLSGRTVFVPDGAGTSFPALTTSPIGATQRYLGTPLRDRHGEVIGVLAMWSAEAGDADDTYRDAIRLLADRAEGELRQREIEGELEKALGHREALFEASHELLIEWDVNQNTTRVSPNVETLLGYSQEHFARLEVHESVHPDDRPALDAAFQQGLQSRHPVDVAIRLLSANGVYRPFSLRMQLAFDNDNGVRASLCAQDQSTRNALEYERDRLASIIENSSDLIALFSLQGNVLSLNESGQRTLGLASQEEARTRTLYDFSHENAARAMKFEIMPAVHRHGQWEGEIELCHLKTRASVLVDGRLFTVIDCATRQPLAVAMLARDTTALRVRDEALLEAEERYRMLADNPYELISELDQAGNFIYASANFETVLGRTPESLLGNVAIELVHPDDRPALAAHFENLACDGGSVQFEVRVQHSDGSYHWVESTLRTYRNTANRMTTIVIAHDITERMEFSETLRQAQHKLQQSQKMEAIGRMAGGVAHDFNNLLTAITGYCDLLLEDLGPQHPSRVDAEEILKASERAAGLTHQLLAFSRRQVLQPRIVDLNNLVADLDRMLRRLIGEDIELVTVLDGTAWPSKADPGQLHQVLLNLVVNSRDAMPRGGRITIETANAAVETPIQTGYDEIPAGDYVTMAVKDTGTGMSAEILSMIFEPFFTTKDSGQGTGLGLSTVIGIVQQTGGYIRVDSRVGRGSSFTVYLPRAEGVAMLPEHNAAPVQFDGSETIMVVEDSEPVRNLVVRCLERHGYAVLQAGSGSEALKLSNRHEGPIELFLCDVVLPKMDGIELGKRVHTARPDSGVIFMSGFTDDGLARHGVDAGDIALLEKPFTPSTLLRTVREYLDDGTVPVPPPRTLPEDDQAL
ncbi:MAG: PAS domain S-box protein [Myxococcota bacterium]|jgi:PAS domain S-box-containing protein|nr:PAS domain S-box protein [Myxococcota bacterium]